MRRLPLLFVALAIAFVVAPSPAARAQEAATEPANVLRLRALDFTPFESALATFKPETAAAIDALLQGGNIPTLQAAMRAGLTSEEVTLYFLARIR